MLRIKGMQPVTFARAWLTGWRPIPTPTHVFVCVADHYEPDWRGASPELQHARVRRWVDEYGPATDGLGDERGRPPQHTFFYPVEAYDDLLIERLAALVRSGFGDIEVHLHHDDDNSAALRDLLELSVEKLHSQHGLLSRDRSGQLRYGFVHGNWALDNSHPTGRWCGVNDELTILRETGCYADFTMPAAPCGAQTKTINQIYYAIDHPQRPKSHDTGQPARTGQRGPTDGLLMIQGPLLIHQSKPWRKPKLENGDLRGTQPPTAERFANWLRAGVAVEGHPRWLFIKLHTHGTQEPITDVLLGPPMREFHQALGRMAGDQGFKYHYVTAREMAQLVHQAERGLPDPDFDNLDWD